jgi:MFS family permease
MQPATHRPWRLTRKPLTIRGWAAWLLASLFFLYAFATRVSPSVMVDELMRDFGVGAAILGNLSAIYFYIYASLQIPIGLMLDKFGPARLLSGGAFVAGAGCALFAVSDSTSLAYAGRLLIGGGAASSWIGALAVIAQNFPRHRFAVLAGGTQAFGMLGATMGQLPVSLLVDSYGWRAAMWSLGSVGIILAMLILVTVRDRSLPQSKPVASAAGIRTAARNPQTWLCALFGMAMVGPLVAFAGLWAVPYLMQVHEMSRTGAAGLASLMFMAWAIGSPVLGGISDRLRKRKTIMVLGASGSTLLLGVLPFMEQVPVAILAALILGIGLSSSAYVVGITLARESNPEQIGSTALGLVNTCVIASGAVLQPLIGYILDRHWTGLAVDGARIYPPEAFAWGLAVLPIACGIGALAALLVRDTPPGGIVDHKAGPARARDRTARIPPFDRGADVASGRKGSSQEQITPHMIDFYRDQARALRARAFAEMVRWCFSRASSSARARSRRVSDDARR